MSWISFALLGDCSIDPITGERSVELILRAHYPVDEDRIYVTIPEFGLSKLVAGIEEELGDDAHRR